MLTAPDQRTDPPEDWWEAAYAEEERRNAEADRIYEECECGPSREYKERRYRRYFP